ncbi:MAG TPA: formyltransferase family protein [Bacteroidota bacterium]|nr:formyltransferase family protein [Bacteroidota bacterium]
MKRKRIVFLGEKPLGFECLKYLHGLPDAEIVGVCTRKSYDGWWGQDGIVPYCAQNGIPVLARRDILNLEVDHLISVLYPFVIEPECIRHASSFSFNLHEAPLPRWRGCNAVSHAILAGDSFFGTTLHEMVPELDAGRIIAKVTFPIADGETAKELYERTAEHSLAMAKTWFPRLLRDEYEFTPVALPNSGTPNPRHSLMNIRQLSDVADLSEALTIARALDFVPWEPAYIQAGAHKYYFCIAGASGREGAHIPHPVQLSYVTNLGRLPFGEFTTATIDTQPRPLFICRDDIYSELYPLRRSVKVLETVLVADEAGRIG